MKVTFPRFQVDCVYPVKVESILTAGPLLYTRYVSLGHMRATSGTQLVKSHLRREEFTVHLYNDTSAQVYNLEITTCKVPSAEGGVYGSSIQRYKCTSIQSQDNNL